MPSLIQRCVTTCIDFKPFFSKLFLYITRWPPCNGYDLFLVADDGGPMIPTFCVCVCCFIPSWNLRPNPTDSPRHQKKQASILINRFRLTSPRRARSVLCCAYRYGEGRLKMPQTDSITTYDLLLNRRAHQYQTHTGAVWCEKRRITPNWQEFKCHN